MAGLREKRTHRIDVAISKETAQGRKVFLDYSQNPSGFRFRDLEKRWQERIRGGQGRPERGRAKSVPFNAA